MIHLRDGKNHPLMAGEFSLYIIHKHVHFPKLHFLNIFLAHYMALTNPNIFDRATTYT